MIRSIIVTLLTLASLAVLAVGLMSYKRGIPDDALWISSLTDKPRFQAAVVGGTIHLVYEMPLSQSAAVNYKGEAFGFYLKKTALFKTYAQGVGGPWWFAFAILGFYPGMTLVRGPVRRWRRRVNGFCTACGYDLTGNISGRCSECGLKIPDKPVRGGWVLRIARHFRFLRPRNIAIFVLTIGALTAGVAAIAGYFVRIDYTTSIKDITGFVEDGTFYLRYCPADYRYLGGDVISEDSITDLKWFMLTQYFEVSVDGRRRAATAFENYLELNLIVTFILFSIYPVFTLVIIPRLRRSKHKPADQTKS